MMDGFWVGLTGVIAAVAVGIKQILDYNRIKKWLCMRNPCANRMSTDQPTDDGASGGTTD